MSAKKQFYGINVIVDTLWGDSGKGKIVDLGSNYVDMVVRFAGGNNAGHTIKYKDGIYKLHLVPSGILHAKILNIIDTGVIIDPFSLELEIKHLIEQGLTITPKQLLISHRSHLVMPWHIMRDGYQEKARQKGKIGTTGRGIGPTYADRTAREGLRMGDLFEKNFEEKLHEEIKRQNIFLTNIVGTKPLSSKEVFEKISATKKFLKPYVANTFEIIQSYKQRKKSILGEGAQGALLDVDLGGFPYVTSSHPTVSGFSISTGIQDHEISSVIGVTKAYATRVGEGPMPTELHDKDGNRLREIGVEYGVTTGRARRCGWLDLPALRYGSVISGTRCIAITKLDVLDSFETIKICTKYRIGSSTIEMPFDVDSRTLQKVQPVYETLHGWKSDTKKITSFDKLPLHARRYITYIENKLKRPVTIISVGADRNQTIFR